MNLVWHIVLKDVSRLRWTLLAFGAFMGLPMALAVTAFPADSLWSAVAPLVGSVFETLVTPVVSYFMVMSLVGEDTVVNGKEFWIVRPISGARLLAAKLLGAGLLLVVLPLLMSFPWWLLHGYGWTELRAAAGKVLVFQTPLLFWALAIASLAANSGKFLAYSLGVFFTPALISTVIVSKFSTGKNLSPEVTETRGWVIGAILLVTVVAVIVNQFLTRRIRRSWVMVGAAALAILATSLFWSWAPAFVKSSSEPAVMASVALQAKTAVQMRPMGATKIPLQISYEISGLPQPYALSLRSATHTLAWPDHSALTDQKGVFLDGPPDSRQAASDHLLLGGSAKHDELRSLAVIVPVPDAAAMQRLINEPAAYRAQIRGTVSKPEIVAELPCVVGAASNRHGFGLEVQSLQVTRSRRVQIQVRQHVPEFVTGDRPLFLATKWSYNRPSNLSYAIINRQQGGCLVAARGQPENVFSAATVRRFDQELIFAPRSPGDEPPGDLTAWLKGAVLVAVVLREEGSFSRTLETPRLSVVGLPPQKLIR